MRKLFTCCLLSLTSLTSTLYGYPPGFNFDAAIGYRQDELEWSTSDPKDSADSIAALKWKDLQLIDFNAFANFTTCNNWYYRVNGNYGRIYSGHVDDRDYSTSATIGDSNISGTDNDSKTLIEKNRLNGGKGETFDVGGGIGYVFKSSGGRLTIVPVIGYMHSEQHLKAYDAVNLYLFDSAPLGKVEGVHSTYNNRWYGGFAAYDMLLNWSCNMKFFGTIQGQMGKYRGTAHWNQRDDIDGDIHHKANFVGFNAQLGFLYNIFCNHSIGISGTYKNMWTHHGEQTFKGISYIVNVYGIATGAEGLDSEQKFHARWTSWSVLANWMWHF